MIITFSGGIEINISAICLEQFPLSLKISQAKIALYRKNVKRMNVFHCK